MDKTTTAVVGITGGIGSGKTAATDRFASHGIEIIDADLMSREVVKPGKQALAAIAEKFGAEQILLADGSLNRRALREIIFADLQKKQWLESLLHPLIRDEIIQRLRAGKPPYCVLASPLLLETDQHTLCNRVLLIDAPEHLQVSRTQQRDQTSEAAVKAIMSNQLSRDKRRAAADDIIVNDSDLAALHAAVDLQHQKYLELFHD
jgi:dephospho-CoA kinase